MWHASNVSFADCHTLLADVIALSAGQLEQVCFACRLLRDRFLDLEEEGDEEPDLSLDQMTSALTRGQAAKLFYQICGELSFMPLSLLSEAVVVLSAV